MVLQKRQESETDDGQDPTDGIRHEVVFGVSDPDASQEGTWGDEESIRESIHSRSNGRSIKTSLEVHREIVCKTTQFIVLFLWKVITYISAKCS